MAHENTLRLVGLALRAGRLEAGEDAAAEACQYRRARLVLLAADAAEGTASRALRAAGECGCVSLETPWSKAELGAALGRGSCAVAAVTDLGLAQAVAGKLADADPARYGGAAERLLRKAERVRERRERSAGAERGKTPSPGKKKRKRGRLFCGVGAQCRNGISHWHI